MKVIIQRVLNAKCVVNEENVSEITSGMMLLVGFTNGDSVEQIDKMVKKIINLRIFEDENKKNESFNSKSKWRNIINITIYSLREPL